MSRSPFSRLSLCAAAIGALAITAFVAAPSLASEDAVVIPAPAMDDISSIEQGQTDVQRTPRFVDDSPGSISIDCSGILKGRS